MTGTVRILLVEDDARFREAFARSVGDALATERLDVAFVGAGTLAEARARLLEGGLNAALIDVGMPDGDGLDLVREISDGGAGERIPTLVLTASLDHTVAARAMGAGARGALSKVVSLPETTETIKRQLEGGHSGGWAPGARPRWNSAGCAEARGCGSGRATGCRN
jgi:CheY-like chemotaxis protein